MKPLTNVNLTLISQADLNPDVNKRPSPVDIRIYQLRNSNAFMHAKFFDLYPDPQKDYSSDIIKEHIVEIGTNQTKEMDIELDEKTQYLGFIIAYYDIEHAQWRDIRQVSAIDAPLSLHLNARDFLIQPS